VESTDVAIDAHCAQPALLPSEEYAFAYHRGTRLSGLYLSPSIYYGSQRWAVIASYLSRDGSHFHPGNRTNKSSAIGSVTRSRMCACGQGGLNDGLRRAQIMKIMFEG